jgi:hypothetical protein
MAPPRGAVRALLEGQGTVLAARSLMLNLLRAMERPSEPRLAAQSMRLRVEGRHHPSGNPWLPLTAPLTRSDVLQGTILCPHYFIACSWDVGSAFACCPLSVSGSAKTINVPPSAV